MRTVLKISIPVIALGMVAAGAIAVGFANANAFDAHAQALRTKWSQFVREGVPTASVTPLSTQLDTLEGKHVGPIPYPFVSLAAFQDPVSTLDNETRDLWDARVGAARMDAETALNGVKQQGADQSTIAADEQQLSIATTPSQLESLASQWNAAARKMAADRAAKIAAEQKLEAQRKAQEAAQKQQLESSKATAAYYLDQVASLIQQYASFGKPTSQYSQQLATLKSQLQAAAKPSDADAVTGTAEQLVGQLNNLIATASTVPTTTKGGCLSNVPAKLIVVHLSSQVLDAYDKGCLFLQTPVTTGRPALPTGQGTFQIFYKSTQYLMRSPWPPGSPYWYPNTWVGYAMEFESDGTFIHTADWEPAGAYGAGSEYGPYASHGCVHVMDGPAATLYGWAPIGTTVIVES